MTQQLCSFSTLFRLIPELIGSVSSVAVCGRGWKLKLAPLHMEHCRHGSVEIRDFRV